MGCISASKPRVGALEYSILTLKKDGKLRSNQFQLLYTKKGQGWSGEREEGKATLLRFTYLYVRKYSHNCWFS